MIDLYTWTTPNGRKVSILLEELGLPYTAHPIDITKRQQFQQDFLKISPNNRIPAIVDRDAGIELMESGAIMIYLADKAGMLLPREGAQRYRAIEWPMWQMGDQGPILAIVQILLRSPIGRVAPFLFAGLTKEAHRLCSVLDRRLADREFVADDYSIADIAIWPWISRFDWQRIDLNQYPNAKRWYGTIAARPAVRRGYQVPTDVGDIPML